MRDVTSEAGMRSRGGKMIGGELINHTSNVVR
jgi:hypothetical protein